MLKASVSMTCFVWRDLPHTAENSYRATSNVDGATKILDSEYGGKCILSSYRSFSTFQVWLDQLDLMLNHFQAERRDFLSV